MPVVHVTQGGLKTPICLGAVICLHAPTAVVPDVGLFSFYEVYKPGSGNVVSHDHRDLDGLPWDKCVEVSVLENYRLTITLAGDQARPIVVLFTSSEKRRLQNNDKVYSLQHVVRRKLLMQKLASQQKLEAVGMGLHPRLGANSPITVDILWMVAEHSLD
jgi:hypothetical protein